MLLISTSSMLAKSLTSPVYVVVGPSYVAQNDISLRSNLLLLSGV